MTVVEQPQPLERAMSDRILTIPINGTYFDIMRRAAIFLSGFLFCCVVAAFIAWCSGYNFDHRNSDVGFYVAMTLFFSGWMGICALGVAGEIGP